MFLSRVVSVSVDEQQVMMAYSDHKPANAEVLGANTVTFKCNHRGAQFAFACSKPRHGAHSGQPAIRMNAPPIVLPRSRGILRRVRSYRPRPMCAATCAWACNRSAPS